MKGKRIATAEGEEQKKCSHAFPQDLNKRGMCRRRGGFFRKRGRKKPSGETVK